MVIPEQAKVIFTSEEKYVRLQELITLLLTIGLSDDDLSVEYWVGIKRKGH